MSLTLKILNAGTLGAIAPLYPPGGTVVGGKTALVKNIIVTNNDSVSFATVNVYANRQGGPDYLISPKDVKIPPGGQFVCDTEISLLLDTGPDRIRGSSTLATTHYVIN